MVSAATVLKNCVNVKHTVIDSFEFDKNLRGEQVLKLHVHPHKTHCRRCPVCGRRCPGYDMSEAERKWRAPDLNGLIIELYYRVSRISCPEHGVITESVPWAFEDSGFTRDFDLTATFFALNINRSVTAEYLRCDWHTVMRCISRARAYVEPDRRKRYEGLVNIGIDETSYRKGHKYITVVVNHDTGALVWCSPGHDKETLSKFFEELTAEQRAGIKSVSGDGARWIDACIEKYIPQAQRCVDGFHVVNWAMEALDELRKEQWRQLNSDARLQAEALKPHRGRPKSTDTAAKKLSEAVKKASNIKTSTYALGKAPERLTANQRHKLEMIAATNPRLYRGYKLKEQLRLVFKLDNETDAKDELDSFFWRATHSRIPVFKELAYKIRRHEEHILNTIKTKLSNARVESVNNKIKLFIRKAFGFRNIQNMLDLIMLGCSKISIPLPNRADNGLKVA